MLFFAGLGGGTGTSTIIKAIEEFSAFHNKPVIAEELKSMAMKIPREELIKINKSMQESLSIMQLNVRISLKWVLWLHFQ